MSHIDRNLEPLNRRKIVYKQMPINDRPSMKHRYYDFYEDGTHECYELFRSRAKITTYKSLKWHLLVLWYLNPQLDPDDFLNLSEIIADKSNGFITFAIPPQLLKKIVYEVSMMELDEPPKNKARKLIFKHDCIYSTEEKLKIVGTLLGRSKIIHADDIYQCMLDIHDQGIKITIFLVANLLKCSSRTIQRNMCEDLKREKRIIKPTTMRRLIYDMYYADEISKEIAGKLLDKLTQIRDKKDTNMKHYNVEGYVRHKHDLEEVIHRNEKGIYYDEHGDVDYTQMKQNTIIIMWMPLVEHLARKFATSQQASGVMDITDLVSCGYLGLCKAVSKLDRQMLSESEDTEKTIKSFLAKRIRGSIRRQIDINRGDMRIPEHKYNEIRKNFGKDKKMVAMFFNSVFLSIDAKSEDDMIYDIPDESEPYNKELLNLYLMSLLQQHLSDKEFQVLRLSYGLDCDKHSATEIADKIGIEGSSSYVRVSQLKKQAVDKLIENVDHSQVLDYL